MTEYQPPPMNGSAAASSSYPDPTPGSLLRIPPHSVEAEMAVLGAMLLDPKEAPDVVRLLVPEDFYRSVHGRLFSVMAGLVFNNEPTDPLLVVRDLERMKWKDDVGGAEYLQAVARCGLDHANAKHYAKIVRDKSVARGLIRAGMEMQRAAYDCEPSDEVAERTIRLVEAMQTHEADTAKPVPWRTLAQVSEDAKKTPRVMVCRAFGLATRTVSFIGGEPKAGKSEIVAAFVAAATKGEEFLGETIARTDVVLVTEEGDHDLAEKVMDRYRADVEAVHVLSRDAVGAPSSWEKTVTDAVAKATDTNSSIVVFDTLAFWAGLEGDDERSEGVMRERLMKLQPARAAGLSTLIVHHSVKAKDVEGIAALRGSGAIAGSAESVVIFKRVGKDPLSEKRKIELWSRITPCLDLAVERVIPKDGGEPHFKPSDQEDSKTGWIAAADTRIISAFGKVGGWMARRQLKEASGIGDRVLEGRLPKLVEGNRLVRMGNGQNKSPFMYALPGTAVPPQTSAQPPQLR